MVVGSARSVGDNLISRDQQIDSFTICGRNVGGITRTGDDVNNGALRFLESRLYLRSGPGYNR